MEPASPQWRLLLQLGESWSAAVLGEGSALCDGGVQGRKGRDRNGVPAAGFSLVSLSNPVSEISTTVKPVPTWKRLI